jgi:hypothetical protein
MKTPAAVSAPIRQILGKGDGRTLSVVKDSQRPAERVRSRIWHGVRTELIETPAGVIAGESGWRCDI